VELNIPIVSPDWLRSCFHARRVLPATEFYVRKYNSQSTINSPNQSNHVVSPLSQVSELAEEEEESK
jgi:hypothetical protein